MNEQRERFESWAEGRFELYWYDNLNQYASKTTQCAWEAWQAACPVGWQCVPTEPTHSMLDATSWPRCAATDYAHMLAAAPKPEDV